MRANCGPVQIVSPVSGKVSSGMRITIDIREEEIERRSSDELVVSAAKMAIPYIVWAKSKWENLESEVKVSE